MVPHWRSPWWVPLTLLIFFHASYFSSEAYISTPHGSLFATRRVATMKSRAAPSLAAAVTTNNADNRPAPPPLNPSRVDRASVQIVTILRLGVPSIIAGTASALAFPSLCRGIISVMCRNGGPAAVCASAGFVEQFLGVMGLLFSLLLGQTYGFVYSQQEAIYYALFNEVTEAKSLLEQVALACQGRAMYPKILGKIKQYVDDDLKNVYSDPAVLLSSRPVDDPLEAVMYMTSVGVPGTVYQTIRSLRQARAARLGALQRKVPPVHLFLLWILASIMLISFPLLGAHRFLPIAPVGLIGLRSELRTVEGLLFGITVFAVVLTKMVVKELLRPAGGAYNVDRVLGIMVRGLDKELIERTEGKRQRG